MKLFSLLVLLTLSVNAFAGISADDMQEVLTNESVVEIIGENDEAGFELTKIEEDKLNIRGLDRSFTLSFTKEKLAKRYNVYINHLFELSIKKL